MSVLTCAVCHRPRPVSWIGHAAICNDCRPELMAEVDARRATGAPVSASAIARELSEHRREILDLIEAESTTPIPDPETDPGGYIRYQRQTCPVGVSAGYGDGKDGPPLLDGAGRPYDYLDAWLKEREKQILGDEGLTNGTD